jgi:hypothetical protein
VRAFGAGREFGGVLGVVLVALDALFAVSDPRSAAIEAERAGELASVTVAGLV